MDRQSAPLWRHDVETQEPRCSSRDHMGIRRLLCRVADVRCHRHSDKSRAELEWDPIWFADVHSGAHRRPVSPATRHLDGQIRRPDRDVPSAGCLCRTALALELCEPVLAIPPAWVGSRRRRSLLRRRHALRRALFPQGAARLCHGRVRRRHHRRGDQHVHRSGPHRPIWLAGRSQGLCRRAARHGGGLLAAVGAGHKRARQERRVAAPANGGIQGPARLEVLPVLLDRFWRLTALSVWMPQYFVSEYGLSIAQASLLAACFSLPAGILRAAGGWLADRFGAHNVTWWVLWAAWISLFLLSYPQTDFIIHTIRGPAQFHIGLPAAIFTMLLFALGVAFAFGMASTFKYVGDDFPDNMGIVTGIVGLAGGLGGFLLPILFGAILDWLGINSSCFMFLYGIVWVSLILNYTTEVRRLPVMGEQVLIGATAIPSVAAVASTKT